MGDLYNRMAARGELVQAGQRVVAVDELLQTALEIYGPPSVVVCDRFRENELRQALEAAAIPGRHLVIRGQGFKDGAADVRLFRRAVLDGLVKVRPSLLLRAALSGAIVVTDPAGNAKLAKQGQGGDASIIETTRQRRPSSPSLRALDGRALPRVHLRS